MDYKKLKKSKGITLIALVVTIIVLLILAGVAISLSIGENGIFKRAQNAVEVHKESSENEVQTMNELTNLIDKYSGENTQTNPKLKVGDYVSYVPETTVKEYNLKKEASGQDEDQIIAQDEQMKWRVFSINSDGTVDIIGDGTTKGVSLSGAIGYNNGVYVLNDICEKIYSNDSLGLKARSIKLEDIENKLNKTGIQNRDEYTNFYGVKYNATNNYKNAIYPALYEKERGSEITGGEANRDGIGVSEAYYNEPTNEDTKEVGESGLTTTNTYYPIRDMSYYDDANLYNLIFGNKCWIASRVVYDTKDIIGWGIRTNYEVETLYYKEEEFDTLHLMERNEPHVSLCNRTNALKPVIKINANIKLENGEGTAENPWKLVK